MTSKISFFKLLKNNLKRHMWYSAILTLAFFLTMPLYVMIRYESRSAFDPVSPRAIEQLERIQDSVIRNVGISLVLSLLTAGAALLGAWSGLSWLHFRKKLDLYASLPYKREKIFLLESVTTFVSFLFSYGVNLLLAFVVVAAKGWMRVDVVRESLIQFAILILYFLVFYAVAAFAMLLTGKLVTGVLATGVILGIGPACKMLLEDYMNFWQTLAYKGFSDVKWSLLSPAAGLVLVQSERGARENFSTTGITWPILIIAVVMGLLLTGLCFLAVKKRPCEGAEKAIAFEKTEGLIKACILYPVGLCGGLVLYYVSGNVRGWLWFGIVFSVLIGNVLMEVIYHLDRKRLLERKGWTVGAGVAALFTAACFLFDIFGYDSWIPEEDEIEAAVAWEDGGTYAVYPDGGWDTGEYLRGQMSQFTKDKLRNLAVEGAAIAAADDSGEAEEDAWNEEVPVYTSVHVCYQLKNGRTKERVYMLPETLWEETRNRLFGTEAYKEAMCPALLYDEDALELDYVSWMGDYKGLQMELTKSEQKELISIYLEELRNADADMLFAKNSGSISIIRKDEIDYPQTESYQEIGGSYPVNAQFTKTVAYLAGKNFYIGKDLSDLEIQEVTVEKWDRETEEWKDQTFRDKESIEAIIQNLDSSESGVMAGNVDVLVTWWNAQEELITASCRYPTVADIPDIVKDFMEEDTADTEEQ